MKHMVNEHWNMVRKNLVTGEVKPCGEYPSRKLGLQYAPDVLDSYLKNYAKCDNIDLRDDLIDDFIAAHGKKAIQYGEYVFFLAQNAFNAYGEMKEEPIVPEICNTPHNLKDDFDNAIHVVDESDDDYSDLEKAVEEMDFDGKVGRCGDWCVAFHGNDWGYEIYLGGEPVARVNYNAEEYELYTRQFARWVNLPEFLRAIDAVGFRNIHEHGDSIR